MTSLHDHILPESGEAVQIHFHVGEALRIEGPEGACAVRTYLLGEDKEVLIGTLDDIMQL